MFPTTKGPPGGRRAWGKEMERCEPLQRASIIPIRPMSPTIVWKKVESNGWESPKRRIQGEAGNWFGKKTAIRPLNPRPTFTMHGSRNDLERIGERIHSHSLSPTRTPTSATGQTWEERCARWMAAQIGLPGIREGQGKVVGQPPDSM